MSEKTVFQNPWVWGGCGCCLGLIILPFALMFLGIGGAFFAFRNVGIQDEAMDRVRANPAVVEALGEPIEMGWMMSGSVNIETDGGEADYSMPISGPNGEGRMYVDAERIDGVWRFDELYVRVDGERIDVIGGVELPMESSAPATPRSEI